MSETHNLKPGHLQQNGSLLLEQTEKTRKALHDAAVSKHRFDFLKSIKLDWRAPEKAKKDC